MAKRKNRTRRNSRDAPQVTPSVSRNAAATSLGDGGSVRKGADAPSNERRSVMLCSEQVWHELCIDGYKPVSQCPEVQMCINAYARSVAMMTIHLMQNVKNGDVRVKNELSRKVDISPAPYMGRTNLMYMLVRQMMAEGNALLYPEVRNGYLEWLRPLPPSQYQLVEEGDGYIVRYNGKNLQPDEVINLVYNPDPERPWKGQGVTVDVREMVKCIRQANTTRNALLESPAPSLIVKVDGLVEDLASPEGHDEMADRYLSNARSGKPWMIPAEAMEVTTVQPLSINDLAIKDNLELDKRAVAAMMGIPAFKVGVGAYNEQEHNMFVATQLPFVTEIIEQELTAKLLISHEMYFRFNKRSLMSYALKDLSAMGQAMTDRLAMRRNEWRELMGFPPDDEMDELIALENYIPADRLGDQKKLNDGVEGGEDSGNEDETQDDGSDGL